MKNLNIKSKVELAIVAVLTLLCVLLTELKILDEHTTQTFGMAAVTFIGVIALLHLHRWVKRIKSHSNNDK